MAPPGKGLQNMKVLIVDDTPANLRLLRAVLEGENFEVAEAEDGVQALAVLEREPVNAVISDILMPNMDGYRFCQEMRRNERTQNLPFIIYSSTYDSKADAKLALEMGADKYIKKPAPIKEITDALLEIVRRGPRARSAPVPPQKELNLAKMYNETLVNKLKQKNEALIEQTEALRASDEKFRQLAENISEVFWIIAADQSEILYISPAYEKTWGRTRRSLYELPRSFLDAVHAADYPRVLNALERLRRGENYDLEYRVTQPDGQIRWVHDRGTAIRNEAGVIYRLAGIAEDITQRKSTEEQLRQAQKMEAIGQLAGGVAHDFNNILMIIGANVELLLMTNENLPFESKQYLNDIAKAGDRAATLTRQLLAFSRSEAMQMQILNLNDQLGNFTKLLGRMLGENIRMVTDFSTAFIPIEADPGMVEQIVMNLAVNARDAMPDGGRLIIRTELQEIDASGARENPNAREGHFACITVEDTGTGIAPENMGRIFEPFFTTKGVGKGTGLGLATVFGIAEQHKGWVDVSSQVGVGTTFRVFLPLTTGKVVTHDTTSRKKIRGGGEKILLAEDDRAVRSVVATTLQRQGYSVLEADSGITAREIWIKEAGAIDLLLTDIVMTGGVTGVELAEALRTEQPGLKIVLMSGYSSQLISNDVAASKNFRFLKKPFTPQILAETVRLALDAGELLATN
jgi:two-component system, cell cycle sensor histidine kinase and response regulator CckA